MKSRHNKINNWSFKELEEALPINLNQIEKVGYLYDEKMALPYHLWDPQYPENPDRLRKPMEKLKNWGILDRCKYIPPRIATKEEILTQHSIDYFETVRETSEMSNDELYELSKKYDDAYFHQTTYCASLLAAGCSIEAVEQVVLQKVQSSFAFVRPPGHHAMKSRACGYCIFNNACISVQHALDNLGIQRVLLVDWDIHHGQGSQFSFYDDPRVLYFSSHRYENGLFWPHLRQSDYDFIGLGPGMGYNLNVPFNKPGLTDSDFLAVFQSLLLPIAYEFDPQLVVVSCGFDAALADPESKNFISPGLFSHLTHMMKGLANGRLCMLLEGGYNMDCLAECIFWTIKSLLGDPCPLLPPMDEPIMASVRESILNCIRVLRPYWKCLAFQDDTNDSQKVIVNDFDQDRIGEVLNRLHNISIKDDDLKNVIKKTSLTDLNSYSDQSYVNDPLIPYPTVMQNPNNNCTNLSNNNETASDIYIHSKIKELNIAKNIEFTDNKILHTQKENHNSFFNKNKSSTSKINMTTPKPGIMFMDPTYPLSDSYIAGYEHQTPEEKREDYLKLKPHLGLAAEAYFPPLHGKKTCIAYNQSVTLHSYLGKDAYHPEQPCRVERIYEKLVESGLMSRCKYISEERLATDEEILLVHTKEYLQKLKSFEEMTEEQLISLTDDAYSHFSVYLSKYVYKSAALAVGCVLNVIDEILSTHNICDNIFSNDLNDVLYSKNESSKSSFDKNNICDDVLHEIAPSSDYGFLNISHKRSILPCNYISTETTPLSNNNESANDLNEGSSSNKICSNVSNDILLSINNKLTDNAEKNYSSSIKNTNHCQNGFALVRPPGHHAKSDNCEGFCFLNSVAIASRYCEKKFGLKRIMIVDWDVHHGNGTQKVFENDPSVLFVSVHRRDGGSFYPCCSDSEDESDYLFVGKKYKNNNNDCIRNVEECFQNKNLIIKVEVEEFENYEEKEKTTNLSTKNHEVLINGEVVLNKSNKIKKLSSDNNKINRGGEGYTINIPWSNGKMTDLEYLAAFQQLVMPVAYEFSPEIILVSCGFDAARKDPLGGCHLTPEIFGHMTHSLSCLAEGRLVLILEGGYNLNSISNCAVSCVSALLGNPLPVLSQIANMSRMMNDNSEELNKRIMKNEHQNRRFNIKSKAGSNNNNKRSEVEINGNSDKKDGKKNVQTISNVAVQIENNISDAVGSIDNVFVEKNKIYNDDFKNNYNIFKNDGNNNRNNENNNLNDILNSVNKPITQLFSKHFSPINDKKEEQILFMNRSEYMKSHEYVKPDAVKTIRDVIGVQKKYWKRLDALDYSLPSREDTLIWLCQQMEEVNNLKYYTAEELYKLFSAGIISNK